MTKCKLNKTCRICDGSKFTKILDLGKQPPANAFLHENKLKKIQEKFPLVVYFCRNCALLQLRDVVNPEILFRDYVYQTSASAPLVAHFKKLAEEIVAKHISSKSDLVVEIGSNDGSLLENLKSSAKILGVDPVPNMAKLAKQKGVPTLTAFFNNKTSEEILKSHGSAKIIIANNVIAHIDDLRSVFAGIKTLLSSDGKFIFESHWAGNLIDKGGFDQIYHEHLCYYSLHALNNLVKQFDLKILDVALVKMHGESLRVTVGKTGVPSKAVESLMQREKELGLNEAETFTKFALKVERNKKILIDLLKKLKKDGKKIVGYGAPAKGNTLLNYYKITPKILDYITDTTPSKQGLFAPGSKIPIVAPEKLLTERPDYVLLLSWNYAEAILQKETALRASGVKFIIPVPEVKII